METSTPIVPQDDAFSQRVESAKGLLRADEAAWIAAAKEKAAIEAAMAAAGDRNIRQYDFSALMEDGETPLLMIVARQLVELDRQLVELDRLQAEIARLKAEITHIQHQQQLEEARP